MRVAMLLHKDVEHDSRVRREAKALAEASHEVTVVHLPRGDSGGSAGSEPYAVRSANPGRLGRSLPGPLRRAVAATRIARVARRERPDVVHAHDAAMLVPGWIAARRSGALLVYDSNELATGVPYRSRAWSLLVAAIERLLVPRCAAVITVSDGIAARLQEIYRLPQRPRVIRNLPDLAPPRDGAGDLRRRLGVDSEPLVLHQGALAADRGCESLLRAMELLPSAHLLLLGAEGSYAESVRELARSGGLEARVHFLPPVPLPDLLSHSAQADVGVSLLEGVCENHRLALPNKVFEYVAAGIPVVTSDLPELGRLVRESGIGFTVDPADPASVADGIRRALAEGAEPDLRANLERAARTFSWNRESGRLTELYGELASGG